MVPTDPIADFLTRIRNASRAHHADIEVPTSRMKEAIAEILKKEGYLSDVRVVPDKGHGKLSVTLRYHANGDPMIKELTRVSKPGCRYYSSASEIPHSGKSLATTILTTSKGIMTDREAREANLGGELICQVK